MPEEILWVGLDGSGMYKLNIKNNTEVLYRESPYDVENIFYLHPGPKGYLWAGTNKGLKKLDRKTGEFELFSHDPDNENSISNNLVKYIFENSKNEFWIGTANGLNIFNLKTEQFKRYLPNPDDPHSISNSIVTSITKTKAGEYWICTGGGLNLFHPETGQFDHISVKDGLPDSVIYAALEDKEGNLWMSTNRGISRLNPVNKSIRNYEQKDGLQDNEFNTNAYYKSPSGEMFFGGINGLNSFYPEKINDNPWPPAVAITSFSIANKPIHAGDEFNSRVILTKNISSTDYIELTHNDYMFSFEFAALDYTAPEKNEYAYMMEGLDSEWNYVGNRRYVTYTTVPPGEYTFRVKGSNNDGVWNENGVSLRINIVPPFWFKSLFTVTILGTVIAVVYMRIKYLQKSNINLQNKVAERTKELNEKSVELEARVHELQGFIAHINRLEGLLPICSSCKKIKLENKDSRKQSSWIEIESYIADRTDADFSHGICPSCMKKLYPELYDKKK